MPKGKIRVDTGHVDALGGGACLPKPPPCLLAQLHEEFCQFPGIIRLLAQGIGIPKAFPGKIYLIYLIDPKTQIPVVAKNALEDPAPSGSCLVYSDGG